MDIDDEDEFAISLTQEERVTRADARREKLRREIQSKTGRDFSGKNLKELKQTIVESKEQKPVISDEKRSDTSARTKSIREREHDEVETAQDKPDVDTMLQRAESATPVSDEEVQSEPG